MAEGGEATGRPGTDALRTWTGHRLDEISGGSVGRVEGFFVAESNGTADWLLARMGRFGHYTLVPSRDAVEGVGEVWVPYSLDQIRRAPRVEPNEPLSAATERALIDHYGIAVDPERARELGELADDAVSAMPG
jgi:hypothetical protein